MNGMGGKNEEGIDHRLHMLDDAHVGGVWRKDVSKDRRGAKFELERYGVG